MKGVYKQSCRVETRNHIKQADSVNYGIYVIHFFSCLVQEINLETSVNILKLRGNLKELLLNNSSNMTLRCLFCTRIVDTTENKLFKCRTCSRFIHQKCLLRVDEINYGIGAEKKILNGICDLCRIH